MKKCNTGGAALRAAWEGGDVSSSVLSGGLSSRAKLSSAKGTITQSKDPEERHGRRNPGALTDNRTWREQDWRWGSLDCATDSLREPVSSLRGCDFFEVTKNRCRKPNSYDDKIVENSKKCHKLSG